MSELQRVNAEELTKILEESTIPVVIDFSTEGCGPCQIVAPLLAELQEEFAGKVRIVNHDVHIDEVLNSSNKHALAYDVMGFPTLVVLKDGEVVDNLIGISDAETLRSSIEKVC